MNKPLLNLQQMYIFLLILLSFSLLPASSYAIEQQDSQVAQIISLQGKAFKRRNFKKQWNTASVLSPLYIGHQLRTDNLSKMGILFRDQSQIRLDQNSFLIVKDVMQQGVRRTHLLINSGRVWAQSKNIPDKLIMETPSAVAAIRGTDWELEVDKDGASRITVLHGQVEFFNDFGRILVKQNEQALAKPGNAPVKIFITNPRQRVQWLRQYRIEAHRFWPHPISDKKLQEKLQQKRHQNMLNQFEQALLAVLENNYSGAWEILQKHLQSDFSAVADSYLLYAALQIYSGQLIEAKSSLIKATQQFPQDPRFNAHLAQVLLLLDEPEQAKQFIDKGLSQNKDSVEILLSLAEWAYWQGDFITARQTYEKIIELYPGEDRAWFGMGKILNETEEYPTARAYLHQAIKLAPDGVGYQGELASLETFTNNFVEAQIAFNQALQKSPDDYTSLSAQGLQFLKQGQLNKAIDQFLKVTLIEPNYARAHAFLAIAYYQLGKVELALQHLRLHQELDDKDPLAYLLQSRIYSDQYQPALAIQSARLALKRLPYLKSMNQLANDQQGSTNTAAALANFALVEWANHYAQESYSADRADSHFFLSEQYHGDYKKNSELIQGFITDPTSFSVSKRADPLLLTPAQHLSAGVLAMYGEKDFAFTSPLSVDKETKIQRSNYFFPWMQLNAYENSLFPISYSLHLQTGEYEGEIKEFSEHDFSHKNVSLGVGGKPHEQVNVFALYKRQFYRFNINSSSHTAQNSDDSFAEALATIDSDSDGQQYRFDLGMEYKASAQSRFWIKGGNGGQGLKQHNNLLTQMHIILYDPIFASESYLNSVDDLKLDVQTREKDLQLRNQLKLSSKAILDWGLEFSSIDQDVESIQYAAILSPTIPQPLSESERIEHKDEQNTHYAVYLSGKYKASKQIDLDLGLFFNIFQSSSKTIESESPEEKNRLSGLYPRLGMAYQWNDQLKLRYAYQKWMKPAADYTLGPLSTAGISLDERFVSRGGQYHRHRFELAWQNYQQTFFSGYAEWEKVRAQGGVANIISNDNLSDLQSLRQNYFDRNQKSTLEQLQTNLNIAEGELYALGLSLNQILHPQFSARVKYVNSYSRQTDSVNMGQPFPYTPRHELTTDLTWIGSSGSRIKGQLQYLSKLSDEDKDYESGWSWYLTAQQELSNRRIRLYSHIRYNHVDKGNLYFFGLEYRL